MRCYQISTASHQNTQKTSLSQKYEEVFKGVPSAFEKLVHEVFFMNENHLQRSI